MINKTKLNFFSRITQIININRSDEDANALMNYERQEKLQFESLNAIYSKASLIVNRSDSLYYLTDKEIKVLQECQKELLTFKQIVMENEKLNKNYVSNILLIMLRVDKNDVIKFYESLNDSFRQAENNKACYALALVYNEEFEKAIKVYEELNRSSNNKFFLELIMCYFAIKKYSIVKEKLKGLPVSKYDSYGYLAMYKMLSENNISSLSESEIQKKANLYNVFPLYHSTAVELLCINKLFNRKKIKEHVKKALSLMDIKNINYSVLITFFSQVKNKGCDKIICSFLRQISDSSIVMQMRLDLYISSDELDESYLSEANEVIAYLKEKEINIHKLNVVKAELYEKWGRKIEALKLYDYAFTQNKEIKIGIKCLQIAYETGEQVEILKYITELTKDDDCKEKMIIANILMKMGEYKYATEFALSAICNNLDLNLNDDLIKNYSIIIMENRAKEEVSDNLDFSWVTLEGKNGKIELLISKYVKQEHDNYGARLIKPDSYFIAELSSHEVGDIVKWNENDMTVKNISVFSDYFEKIFFNAIYDDYDKGCSSVQIITSDGEDGLNGIKKVMREQQENFYKTYRLYDKEFNKEENPARTLPLSVFKRNLGLLDVINEFLFNPKLKLYSGKCINIDITKEFVLDISSLIVMSLNGFLFLLEPYCNNIVVLQSTLNQLGLILKEVQKKKIGQMSISMNDRDELVRDEVTSESKKSEIKFVLKIINFVKKCKVVPFERDNIHDILEKYQSDSVKYAIENKIPFVCDDLCVRKIYHCEANESVSSNCIFVLKSLLFEQKIDEFLNYLLGLSRCNYIYCINDEIFTCLIEFDQSSKFSEDNYESIKEIIDNIYSSKFLFNLYYAEAQKVIEKLNSTDLSKTNVYRILLYKSYAFFKKYY